MLKYHTGKVKGEQKTDETGVAHWELVRILNEAGFDDQKHLAANAGVPEPMVSVIFTGTQKWVSLKVADALLRAVGRWSDLNTMTIIPGSRKSDAIQMAVYEYLDDNDELTVSESVIRERAQELRELREAMLNG